MQTFLQQKTNKAPYIKTTYLKILPMVMLKIDIGTLARIRPSRMVMALPRMGRKAKNPIHAPLPAMKR